MAKTYHNVEGMVKGLSEDSGFNDDVLHEIRNKRISKYLFFLRCERGLTQAQLAKKIKCSQGTISKIENSYDKDIKVEDLLAYGQALDFQLGLNFRRKGKVLIVDLIEYHITKIQDLLNKLTNLAGKDKAMITGVSKVLGDAVIRLLDIFSYTDSKLKAASFKESREFIHITPPITESKKKSLSTTI